MGRLRLSCRWHGLCEICLELLAMCLSGPKGSGIFTGDGTHAVAQYDRTMKRLTSVFTCDYVRFALGPDVKGGEQVRRGQGRSELEVLLRRAIVIESLEAFAWELG